MNIIAYIRYTGLTSILLYLVLRTFAKDKTFISLILSIHKYITQTLQTMLKFDFIVKKQYC